MNATQVSLGLFQVVILSLALYFIYGKIWELTKTKMLRWTLLFFSLWYYFSGGMLLYVLNDNKGILNQDLVYAAMVSLSYALFWTVSFFMNKKSLLVFGVILVMSIYIENMIGVIAFTKKYDGNFAFCIILTALVALVLEHKSTRKSKLPVQVQSS